MKSFLVQPFCQRIYVTDDPQAFVRKYNRHAPDDARMTVSELNTCVGMAAHLDSPTNSPVFIIYLRADSDDATLYHEALHMTHYVMDYSGAPLSIESTETQAYLMTYIADITRKKLL